MSNVYYQVLGIIIKETKNKMTLKEVLMAILFLSLYIGFFFSLIILASGLINFLSIIAFIVCFLGMIAWIYIVGKIVSKTKKGNFSIITKKIATEMTLIGIDSFEKIDTLIQEIHNMNDLEKENRKDIVKIINVVAKYIIIIPISFFVGFIFKEGQVIETELIFQIILGCIIIFIIIFGFIIATASNFQYFFTSGKKKREMVLSRLLDIKYIYDYEDKRKIEI